MNKIEKNLEKNWWNWKKFEVTILHLLLMFYTLKEKYVRLIFKKSNTNCEKQLTLKLYQINYPTANKLQDYYEE